MSLLFSLRGPSSRRTNRLHDRVEEWWPLLLLVEKLQMCIRSRPQRRERERTVMMSRSSLCAISATTRRYVSFRYMDLPLDAAAGAVYCSSWYCYAGESGVLGARTINRNNGDRINNSGRRRTSFSGSCWRMYLDAYVCTRVHVVYYSIVCGYIILLLIAVRSERSPALM